MNNDRVVKLLMVVGGVLVIGVIGFLFRSGEDISTAKAELTVWGVVPESVFSEAFGAYHKTVAEGITFKYVEKDVDTMQRELVEALASGKGPDIWMTDEKSIQSQRNFISTPPSDMMSLRTFSSSYIDAAAQAFILTNSDGKQVVAAVPLWADPLVLYWNKDIFNRKAIANPPTNWTLFQQHAQLLTDIRSGDNIALSGAAMGRARNIPEYRDIISLLMAQYGGTFYNSAGKSTFGDQRNTPSGVQDPTYQALRFYSDFGNSGLTSYSWNTQFSSPETEFRQERLAMMIAPSSYVPALKQKNPHLKFDIAAIPQLEGSSRAITATHLVGFVVNKTSSKQREAWNAAIWLSGSEGAKLVLSERPVAPANRSLIGSFPHPIYGSMLATSALQAIHLIDTDPELTGEILYDAVESIADRRTTVSEAIRIGKLRLTTEN